MGRRLLCGMTAAMVITMGVFAAQAAAPAPLPLEAFANLPMVTELSLSPDGARYAALLNAGESTVLATRELEGTQPLKPILRTDNREFRFAWMLWVNDERLLVSVAYPSRRGWIEVSETRLFSIRKDGGEPLNLVNRSAFDNRNQVAQFQDRVVDWLPEDGHHVLLEIAEDGVEPSVYKVNVDTGKRQRYFAGRFGVGRWMTDRQHRVRVGTRTKGTNIEVMICEPDGSRWRTAWQFNQLGREAVWPVGFGNDAQRLFVLADHEGRQALFEVDLADPALPRKLRLADPNFDLGGDLILDPKTHEPIGIRGAGFSGDASTALWSEPYKALLRSIDQALPDRRNQVLQFSADGTRYLLHSIGNGIPGQYLIGLRERNSMSILADTYPALVDQPLARKHGVMVTARDGTPLPTLLTLPLGREPKGLPLVLLPHGGPIGSDSMEFDPWVQFLADRGYAVLQVNFRGSEGFGFQHRNAGLKRWGLEMQDDLSDAVRWAIEKGYADASRVCVVGASYGGYAALMGAAKTPELYRCVVSFAGVSDLLDLAAHERQFIDGGAYFNDTIGSTWDDRDRLKATSPRRLAEKFRAPVLLIHGTLDRSVRFEQSEDMAKALKSAGKTYRFVRQEDGDHHLSNQAHRTEFFRELEAFLAEHLPTRQQ